MEDLKERIVVVEEKAASAHKRLDTYGLEISSLRESRHLHSSELQRQQGLISVHAETLKNHQEVINHLTGVVDTLQEAVTEFKTMIRVGTGSAVIIASLLIFIATNLLGLWG